MRACAGAILFCALFGTLMESLQVVIQPHDRFFSVGDIVANITGAACFVLFESLWTGSRATVTRG